MAKTIISKRCSKCKQTKPISEFYKSPRNRDGYKNNCKTCFLKYVKEHKQTEEGKTVIKSYQRSEKGKVAICRAVKKYQKTTKGKAYLQVATKRFYAQYPEKRKAVDVVKYAIQTGKLPRPNTLPCHYCPKPAQHYHHWRGYELKYRLDVIPVCAKCHRNRR